MLENISNQKSSVKRIFLVHGEFKTQQKFAEYLGQNGFSKVSIPKVGEEIVL